MIDTSPREAVGEFYWPVPLPSEAAYSSIAIVDQGEAAYDREQRRSFPGSVVHDFWNV
jgi:hypothetical protein